jgi:hypothetical protein
VAAKPDFSGDYQLNRPASVLEGGAASVLSAVLTLEHHEPTVHFQSEVTFPDSTKQFDYTLETGSDALRWDGDVLLFTYADDAMAMTWRYELDETRRRLTATERLRAAGRDQDNVWVYERRDPA